MLPSPTLELQTQYAKLELSSSIGITVTNAIIIYLSHHGTIESFRLEKTSKIIKSNRQPNTTMPAKPCPEVPHLHVF